MVLPNMTEHVKQRYRPVRGKPRTFAVGDTVWVWDFQPSVRHKWIQGK